MSDGDLIAELRTISIIYPQFSTSLNAAAARLQSLVGERWDIKEVANELPKTHCIILVRPTPRDGYNDGWQQVFYDDLDQTVSAEEWGGPIRETCIQWCEHPPLANPPKHRQPPKGQNDAKG